MTFLLSFFIQFSKNFNTTWLLSVKSTIIYLTKIMKSRYYTFTFSSTHCTIFRTNQMFVRLRVDSSFFFIHSYNCIFHYIWIILEFLIYFCGIVKFFSLYNIIVYLCIYCVSSMPTQCIKTTKQMTSFTIIMGSLSSQDSRYKASTWNFCFWKLIVLMVAF